MAFSWGKFLALAHELSSRGDEASLRTAASRAYYFAYHLAEPIAKASPKWAAARSSCRGYHQAVWKVLSEDARAEAQEAGDEGEDLRELRTRADYEKLATLAKSEVEAAIKAAERIETRLRSC